MIAKVKLKCGNPTCSSMLAVVRGLVDDGRHRVEYWDAIDADWGMADWSQAFRDAMTELTVTGQSWGDLVASGRRPSFDHWQVRCRDCGQVIAGHLPDLIAILRQAFSENTRKVVLTKDSIAKVRADRENQSPSDDGQPRTVAARRRDGTQETITISAQIADPADRATDQTDDPS